MVRSQQVRCTTRGLDLNQAVQNQTKRILTMNVRFFLKTVTVDSGDNQKLSRLQIKLQGPPPVPLGAGPDPAAVCARPGSVGDPWEGKAEDQGARQETQTQRWGRRQPAKANLRARSRLGPILIISHWKGKNLSCKKWSKEAGEPQPRMCCL